MGDTDHVNGRKLCSYSIVIPAPPPAIANVAYIYKQAGSGLHVYLVEKGMSVKKGDPLVAWGGVASLAVKDGMFASIIEKLTGRDPAASNLLSPIDGVVDWVSDSPNVSSDWNMLGTKLDTNDPNYSLQNIIRIRPFADQAEITDIAYAYSQLVAYAQRHKNNFSIRRQRTERYRSEAIDSETEMIRNQSPLIIHSLKN